MISVVIPSYNGAETLFQAIDSVLCQTTKTPLEILVIDDHSTDDTLEKMGRYGENDRVRYIRNETNKGASASRNRGVQLAKGDYIAFLDADDYWDPEKLEKQEKALAKTGDVLCCTGRELIYDQEPEKQKIFSVPERITYKMLLRGNVIGCSSVLAKRSVLLEFPMEKDECHEDYLDWLRILKKYRPAAWPLTWRKLAKIPPLWRWWRLGSPPACWNPSVRVSWSPSKVTPRPPWPV